ncbi:MAG: nucleotidyltransferase domain-containing protein [Pseudonocardia sp.]|nr:nucleotidyltransferase domain-containing protein [Pseudonocardia sp.]
MLDPHSIDLDELCVALDSQYGEMSWWIDPATGEIRPHIPDVDGDETPEEDGWTFVPPSGTREGYHDMEDFAAVVPDRRVSGLLERAIVGRGAFRRFKDVLFDLPELREQWFRFRDARARRRALDWLEDVGLISSEDAARARAVHDDPVLIADPLAAAVAADLAELYGDRLRQVLIFGSRARGDHTEESDLDLLVVLADPVQPWQELRSMREVLWRHFDRSCVVIAALPVAESTWHAPTEPVLIRAAAEAVRVA